MSKILYVLEVRLLIAELRGEIRAIEERVTALRGLTNDRYVEYLGSDQTIRLLKNRVEVLEKIAEEIVQRNVYGEVSGSDELKEAIDEVKRYREQKESEQALKPCPFCREVKDLTVRRDEKMISGYCVCCGCCWTKGPMRDTEKGAKREWNRCRQREAEDFERKCIFTSGRRVCGLPGATYEEVNCGVDCRGQHAVLPET